MIAACNPFTERGWRSGFCCFSGSTGLLFGTSPVEGRKTYPALKFLTSLFHLSSVSDELLPGKACEAA